MSTLAFTFAQPALLLGITACVIPFLLHFLLRPRPKRVRYPALSLFRRALATGQRARRIQDYRLLATRMLLLAAAATLLAGPTCDAPGAAVEGGPRAIAMVVDDSWSTNYRLDESSTVLDSLRDAARRLVQQWAGDRNAVTFSLVRNAPDAADIDPTADRASLLPAVEMLGSGPPHARGLASALQRALRQLQTARQPRRELVIVTDGAAHAWNDVPAKLLAGLPSTTVRVITPPAGQRTNLAVLGASLDSFVARDATPIAIGVSVNAVGVAAQASLIAKLDGREAARVSPIELAADISTDVPLLIPPQPIGRHALSLELEPPDRLLEDQVFYGVLEVRAKPIAWLLSGTDGRATAHEDLATVILRNLLAPETLDAAAQTVALHVITTDRPLPGASDPDGPPTLIIVPSGTLVSDAHAEQLRKVVESGATLLLACSSETESTDWIGLRSLFSIREPQVEILAAVTSIATGENASSTPGLAELARCVIRRRVKIAEPREGVFVDASFTDGEPAILSRRLGRGRVVLLATSPDPAWGDLGIRAAGLLEWLHALMRSGEGTGAQSSYLAGTTLESLPFEMPERSQYTLTRQFPPDSRTLTLRIVDGKVEPRVTTDQPGVYGLRKSGSDASIPAYAVNWPADESRLERVELDRLRQILGVNEIAFDTTESIGAGDAQRQPTARKIDPKLPLAAFLLAALVAEVWLSRSPRAAGTRVVGT